MKHKERFSARFAKQAMDWTGSSAAFFLAVSTVAIWIVTGPIFDFSNTWQLVINTGTTVITFLMVFLIQRAQNKDAQAIHLKLNELVAATKGASNRLINAESMTEHDLHVLHRYYTEISRLARQEAHITESHSVEEAKERHSKKVTAAAGA